VITCCCLKAHGVIEYRGRHYGWKNKWLKSLDVSISSLSSSWSLMVDALATRPGLRRICLDNCYGLHLGLLASCPGLECISIGYSGDMEGVAVLAESVSSLQTICLFGEMVGERLVHALAKSNVKTLTLRSCAFCDKAVVGQLVWLVQELTVSGCNLGNEGAKFVAEALAKNAALEYLDVSGNNIGHVGCVAFANAIKTNPTLKVLNLSSNRGMEDKGVITIVEAVVTNCSLKSLKLQSCGVIDAGFSAVANMLEFNTALSDLDVSRNRFVASRSAALARALSINKTLQTLSLGTDWQKSDVFVTELMRVNGTITRLILGGRKMKQLIHRNKQMHSAARGAVMCFVLCCRRRNVLNKDLVVPIAKMIWMTRSDFAWDKQFEN